MKIEIEIFALFTCQSAFRKLLFSRMCGGWIVKPVFHLLAEVTIFFSEPRKLSLFYVYVYMRNSIVMSNVVNR